MGGSSAGCAGLCGMGLDVDMDDEAREAGEGEALHEALHVSGLQRNDVFGDC